MDSIFESFFVSFTGIADTSKIQGNDTDRSRHFCRSEKSISPFYKLTEIELETTTHRSDCSRSIGSFIWDFRDCTIRIFHAFILGTDEVLEVWKSIFRSHLEEGIDSLTFPWEIFGDIIGRDRKSKRTSSVIPLSIDLEKRAVDHLTFTIELTIGLLIDSFIISTKVKAFFTKVIWT
jgi:hypothetical protein